MFAFIDLNYLSGQCWHYVNLILCGQNYGSFGTWFIMFMKSNELGHGLLQLKAVSVPASSNTWYIEADEQKGWYFADDIFNCFLLNEKFYVSLNEKFYVSFQNSLSWKFIYVKSGLVQVMAWSQAGSKPLPEPMITNFYHAIWHHWPGHSEFTNLMEW